MDAGSEVIGVVLAGGRSRRMGGGDKGLRLLGGRTMLEHVIERLRPQVAKLVLNANGDPSRFAAFGLPVIADTVAGSAGPLAGMLAGLHYAAAQRPPARFVATAASDTPFLPGDLVARLRERLSDREDAIAVAASPSGLHQTCALIPVALAGDLAAALRSGVRKVLDWMERHGVLAVELPSIAAGGRSIDPFFNANTPEELAQAEAIFAQLAVRHRK